MKAKIRLQINSEPSPVRKTNLTEIFHQDSLQIPVDKKKKEQSLLLLHQEIEHKKIIPLSSKREIIRAQMRFLDYKVIAIQGICLLLLLSVYWFFHNTMQERIIYIPITASAPIFSMFMMIGCNREETFGIAELAGSCFFNHRQICALRMILYGIINLLFMTVLSLALSGNVQKNAVEIGIYFLVPFLMTGCVQFMVLLMGLGKKNNYGLIAIGLFMTVLWVEVSTFSEVYEQTALGIWVFILLLCIAGYSFEAAMMLEKMKRGDLLCMN